MDSCANMYRNHWTCIGIIGLYHQQAVHFCFLFCFYQIDRGRWTQVFFYVFDGCGNIGIIIGLISIPEIQKCHWDRPACSIARLESTVRQDSWQQWHPLGGTKELRASAAGILNAWLTSWNDQGYLERVVSVLKWPRVSWTRDSASW